VLRLSAAATALIAASRIAGAQTYPARPVRIIVGVAELILRIALVHFPTARFV